MLISELIFWAKVFAIFKGRIAAIVLEFRNEDSVFLLCHLSWVGSHPRNEVSEVLMTSVLVLF